MAEKTKGGTRRQRPWAGLAKITSNVIRGRFGLDRKPKSTRRRLQEFFRRVTKKKKRRRLNRRHRKAVRALHRVRRARQQNQKTGAKR